MDYLDQLKTNAQPFLRKGLLEIKLNAKSNKVLITTKEGKFLADGIASDLFML